MKQEIIRVENLNSISRDEAKLNNINIDLFEGELLCIFGPPEYGSTTLAKIIAGFIEFDTGNLYIRGKSPKGYNLKKAQEMGIFYLGGNGILVPNMNVIDNILAIKRIRGINFIYNENKEINEVEKLFNKFGLKKIFYKYIYELDEDEALIVQIVKFLLLDAKVIILDNLILSNYKMRLLRSLEWIRKQKNISIIHTSSAPNKIVEIADRIIAMQKGKVIKIIYHEDFSYTLLNRCVYGRELGNYSIRKLNEPGKKILNISNVPVGKRKISLSLAEKEIIGILDFDGSGRQIINTLTQKSIKGLTIEGKKVNSYEDAVKKGMAVVKSTFGFNDYFKCFDVGKNITFQILKKISRLGIINTKLEKYVLNNLDFDILDINKQPKNYLYIRIQLQRILLAAPKVLIVDDISLKFDSRIIKEFYMILDKEVKKKLSILIIFSNINDSINFCDKIYVPSKTDNTFIGYTRNNIDKASL